MSRSKTGRTLSTLIRLGRALTDTDPVSTDPAEVAGHAARGVGRRVGGAVQGAAERLRERSLDVRTRLEESADARLERLITERRAGSGTPAPDPEALAVLARRRQEREDRVARLRAREALLAQAQTPAQRQVLQAVAALTPWAGGAAGELRYTTLLDRLAPRGDAAGEMAVHRALWTLAERRVLSVSPHGVVRAERPPLALPPA